MPGRYNGEGIPVDQFFNGPDGEYILTIVDATPGTTGNGDPKVTVDYVVAEGASKGLPINYHTITFFKKKDTKGAGIALKFLKSIGEPFEGEFTWDERNWIGKKVKAMVVMEAQTQGKNVGKKFPKVLWVNAPEGGQPPTDEVPF